MNSTFRPQISSPSRLLVVLEGLLSADNALVMAIMVLGLPRKHQQKALRFGLIGGFGLRILATVLAVYLIRVVWVKRPADSTCCIWSTSISRKRWGRGAAHAARREPAFGLSAFWATILKVEMVNLAFSVDSILVAVAMSPKAWVVITGGILGIVALRLVVGQLLVHHPEISGDRRRRVRHHRAGSASSCCSSSSTTSTSGVVRDPEVAVAGRDWRDFRRRIVVCPPAGSEGRQKAPG